MGASGVDELQGGTNGSNIGDGLFGGDGTDTLYGNDDDGTSSAPDYIIGGPLADTIVPGALPSDEYYEETQPESGDFCPSASSAKIGVYAPARLALYNQAVPCVKVSGEIAALGFGGDGDRALVITISFISDGVATEIDVELMPRDKKGFGDLGLAVGQPITIRGLHILDTNHNNKEEVHPVYKVIYGSVCPSTAPCFSGPKYGGSPTSLRPANTVYVDGNDAPDKPGHRYCWEDLGSPCTSWKAGDTVFW